MNSRNPNGAGTFFTKVLPNGQTRYFWRVRKDGQVKEISAKTQKVLKQKIKEWQNSLVNGYGKMKMLTLAEFISLYLRTSTASLKQKTLDGYEIICRRFLIPEPLGILKLNDISPMLIEEFLINLRKKYSAAYVSNIRRCLHTILNGAIKQGYLSINPCSMARTPRNVKKEVIILNQEQIRNLLSVAKEGKYAMSKHYTDNDATALQRKCFYTALFLTIYSGIRIGECFGLDWGNVDFNNNSIRIVKSLTNDKLGRHLETPKSKSSEREIKLPQFVMDELKKWEKCQKEFKFKYNNLGVNSLNLVFPTSVGTLYNVSNLYRRYWKKLKAASNLPMGLRWHHLRHTHASLLVKANIPITEITRRLGHSDSSVTLRVYAHAFKTDEEQIIRVLEGWWDKNNV